MNEQIAASTFLLLLLFGLILGYALGKIFTLLERQHPRMVSFLMPGWVILKLLLILFLVQLFGGMIDEQVMRITHFSDDLMWVYWFMYAVFILSYLIGLAIGMRWTFHKGDS